MSWSSLSKEIRACEKCPRLLAHCRTIAKTRRRKFRDEDYWGKPVPGFGDQNARIWIVGLAPGAHGANRTGRMFTGDSSGLWLYGALHRHGFANLAESTHHTDAMRLKDIYISAAARCAPPDNKPTPSELALCADYLDEEFRLLNHLEGFLALGAIAFGAIRTLLKRHGTDVDGKFGHANLAAAGRFWVLSSYHPSQQNTQTGRLTPPMWDGIFTTARKAIRTDRRSGLP